MVRPKKPKSVRKERTVVLRVSAAEKREFKRAARRAGAGGVSTWIRMLATREARRAGFVS